MRSTHIRRPGSRVHLEFMGICEMLYRAISMQSNLAGDGMGEIMGRIEVVWLWA